MKILLVTALLSVLAQEVVFATEQQEVERIISKNALKSYETKYKEAENHKAFAQSETGSWTWKKNMTTKEYAIKAALIGCQLNNKKHEEKYPCKIINVDGSWINSTNTITK